MPPVSGAENARRERLRGGFVGSGPGGPACGLTALVGNVLFRTEGHRRCAHFEMENVCVGPDLYV